MVNNSILGEVYYINEYVYNTIHSHLYVLNGSRLINK